MVTIFIILLILIFISAVIGFSKRPILVFFLSFVIIFIIAIGISLSFHFVPSRNKMFPKDNLSLSYTIIDEEDISRMVERYNNASIFQKQAINQEPLTRKLMEFEIIHETKNESESNNNY
jgi:hypothetical protein